MRLRSITDITFEYQFFPSSVRQIYTFLFDIINARPSNNQGHTTLNKTSLERNWLMQKRLLSFPTSIISNSLPVTKDFIFVDHQSL